MKKSKSLQADVEENSVTKTPKRFFNIDEAMAGENPKEIAEEVLKKVAGELQIDPDLSQLKFEQVKESVLGKHVLFQQQHEGKPISKAWARVDIDPKGKVFQIENDLIPTKTLNKAKAKMAKKVVSEISTEEAETKAREACASDPQSTKILETEKIFLPVGGEPTPAVKVVLKQEKPAGAWKVYVNALTGEVIDKIDLLKRIDGRGWVFDPNPVATLNNTSFEEDSEIPDEAYKEVLLPDLDGSGFLQENLSSPSQRQTA